MNWRKVPCLSLRQLHHHTSHGTFCALSYAESEWRPAAEWHQSQVHRLLSPGLLKREDSALGRSHKTSEQGSLVPLWTPLDPKHPVYNFLIEYYGLKGAKGPRRLARWSPYSGRLLDRRRSNEPRLNGADVFLEGATEQDLGDLLHRRGASFDDGAIGVLYSPSQHFTRSNVDIVRVIGPFLWYQRILERTLLAEPVMHCYGLHEWAMLYRPQGAPPPPSAKYQAHLPLRCDQKLINDVVEGNGHNTKLSCTHDDAMRFFAPAASPLNAFGSVDTLQRGDQLKIEQPACVHAQMDLLKIALKLQPYVDPALVVRALDLALKARRLDVAASPYDASMYDVDPICIETTEGRSRYRQEQMNLTLQAKSIRHEMLEAYRSFLHFAFAPDDVERAIAAFDCTWQTQQERGRRATQSS